MVESHIHEHSTSRVKLTRGRIHRCTLEWNPDPCRITLTLTNIHECIAPVKKYTTTATRPGGYKHRRRLVTYNSKHLTYAVFKTPNQCITMSKVLRCNLILFTLNSNKEGLQTICMPERFFLRAYIFSVPKVVPPLAHPRKTSQQPVCKQRCSGNNRAQPRTTGGL